MKKRLALFLATGFFVGYFPFAPGTIGTLLGVFIYWVSGGYLLLSLPLFFLLSLWSIKQASSLLEEDD
ncbi:phosphatidylglycerophosphatase A, partial [bacterium]|nr:phosphatidylglycerophosphatase A [bacterium]